MSSPENGTPDHDATGIPKDVNPDAPPSSQNGPEVILDLTDLLRSLGVELPGEE